MRLFAALPIPAPLQQELSTLLSDCDGLRLPPPEQLHVTLLFIGEVNPRDLSPIAEALASVDIPLLTLHSEGLFDTGQGALGLRIHPEPALLRLQKQLHATVEELGIVRLERRRYRPHLTLARYQRHTPPDLGDRVAQLQRHPLQWQCERFALYSSQLRPEGARYQLEAEYQRPPSLRPRGRRRPA